MADTIFMALGTVAVLAAIFCISQRNALAAAIWLVVTMLSLAGMSKLIVGTDFVAPTLLLETLCQQHAMEGVDARPMAASELAPVAANFRKSRRVSNMLNLEQVG